MEGPACGRSRQVEKLSGGRVKPFATLWPATDALACTCPPLTSFSFVLARRYAKDLADHERRAAEMQAAKSRAESVMETAAQETNAKTRALNAMREGEEETLSKLAELQKAHEEARARLEKAEEELRIEKLDKNGALNEVARWKEVSELAEKELRKEDVEVEEAVGKLRVYEEELRLAEGYKEQQAKLIRELQVRKWLGGGGKEGVVGAPLQIVLC